MNIISNSNPDFCKIYVAIEGGHIDFLLHCVIGRKRWNGWLAPLLDKDAVLTLIEEINSLDSDNPYYTFTWKGEILSISDINNPEDFEEVFPDSNGLYNCQFGWVWEAGNRYSRKAIEEKNCYA
jgi:hypothetical protein